MVHSDILPHAIDSSTSSLVNEHLNRGFMNIKVGPKSK